MPFITPQGPCSAGPSGQYLYTVILRMIPTDARYIFPWGTGSRLFKVPVDTSRVDIPPLQPFGISAINEAETD